MTHDIPHPLCALLRDLREAAGLSLAQVEARHGTSVGTLGSYERGSRLPPLPVLEALLAFYGYRLEAVPADTAVRRPVDVAAELHRLADQVAATGRGTVHAEAAGIQVADKLTREDVARMYGVPPAMVGAEEAPGPAGAG